MNSLTSRVRSNRGPLTVVAIGAIAGGAAALGYKQYNIKQASEEDAPAGGDEELRPPNPFTPMVAIYLDETSVKTLHDLYPDTYTSRLRTVSLESRTTDEKRELYEPIYGETAVVKLIGEASSEKIRALTGSISIDEVEVTPPTLPAVVDVTPAEGGGGPLESGVLLEQLSRAGATKESHWEGRVPEMTFEHELFHDQEAIYVRFEEPVTVRGSLCRSDWVDAGTGRCRTELKDNEERKGFEVSHCSLCNLFSSSPCHDIFKRWEPAINRPEFTGKDRSRKAAEASADDSSARETAPREGEVAESLDGGNEGQEGESAISAERDTGEADEEDELKQAQLRRETFAINAEFNKCLFEYDILRRAQARLPPPDPEDGPSAPKSQESPSAPESQESSSAPESRESPSAPESEDSSSAAEPVEGMSQEKAHSVPS